MGLESGTKKGFNFYYNWDEEYEDLTDRQFRLCIKAIIQFDKFGEVTDKKLLEELQSNSLSKLALSVMKRDTEIGSKGWHSKNKSKNPERYDENGNYETSIYFDEEKRLEKKITKYIKLKYGKEKLIYVNSNKDNIPNFEYIKEILGEDYNENTVIKAIKQGNKELWNRTIDDYLIEINKEDEDDEDE